MRTKMNSRPALLAGVVLAAVGPIGAPGAADAAPYTCEGRTATKVGTNASETINGTAANDVIVGLGGNDVINGLGGNDIICGVEGADKLFGGDGDDRLWGQRDGLIRNSEGELALRGDLIDGGAGDDKIVPGLDTRAPVGVPEVVTYADSPAGITTDVSLGPATGWGSDAIAWHGGVKFVGSSHADHIRGTLGPDNLEAGPGDDVVEGRAGDDAIDLGEALAGGTDNDVAYLGDGNDVVAARRLASGTDKIVAGNGNDFVSLVGNGGRVYGEEGLDEIYIASADPSLVTASGGPGRDLFRLTTRSVGPAQTVTLDALTGQILFSTAPGKVGQLAGIENYHEFGDYLLRFNGSDLPETLQFNGERARLHATMNAGDDTVYGVPFGPDYIDGGDGSDYADGRGGEDTLISIERR